VRYGAAARAPAPPLLLTDKPWEQIEREWRKREMGVFLSDSWAPRGGLGLPPPPIPPAVPVPRLGPEPPPLLSAEPIEEIVDGRGPRDEQGMVPTRRWHRRPEEIRRRQDAARRIREERASKLNTPKRRNRREQWETAGREQRELLEAQERARLEAQERARLEAEQQAREEAEERERAAAVRRAQEHAERIAKLRVPWDAERARIALLEAKLVEAIRDGLPADGVAKSFMIGDEWETLGHDMALARANLELVQAAARTIAASLETLAGAAVSEEALAAVGAPRKLRPPPGMGPRCERLDDAWTEHLHATAIGRKAHELVGAAELAVGSKLNPAAAATIRNTSAGNTKETVKAAILAAVKQQKNPPSADWLRLLKADVAGSGRLVIRPLGTVSPNPPNPLAKGYAVHLSVYLDAQTEIAKGVDARLSDIVDAILPSLGVCGAHLTVEVYGRFASTKNPHYYRGGICVVNDYPLGAGWVEIKRSLAVKMGELKRELESSITQFCEARGRWPDLF